MVNVPGFKDAQSDYHSDMQQLVNRIASKVGDIMTDYAHKHGYTLVIDVSQEQQTPTVLYWSPSSDITKAVVEAYNEKSGVSVPSAPAIPDAPKPSQAN